MAHRPRSPCDRAKDAMTATESTAAPSAPVSPPQPAAPPATGSATPAPVAEAPALQTLEDYARYAAQALDGNATPPSTATPPNPEAAIESPAADEGTVEPTAPPPVADGEDAEVTPEEQANWTDAERRIYGALQKERQKRKDAREESRLLREQVDELKGKLTPATKPEAAPPTDAAPASPSASVPVTEQPLGDCMTFEAIDARAMQAARAEAQVLKLQQTLARKGAEQAAAALAEQGVTHIGNTPVAEATDDQIGDFLSGVYEGARVTQTAAPARKQFLVQQAQSFEGAKKLVPELTDPKHERAQRFVAITQRNPWLRSLGPQWPEVAATYLLGEEAKARAVTPPKPAAPPPLTPTPTQRTAPAAPRTSAGGAPRRTELDGIRERISGGNASANDMQRYAELQLSTA